MQKVRRILLPVDLADFSPRIVPFVASTVEQFRAELHLLYVARDLHEVTAGVLPDLDSVRRFQEEALREAQVQLEQLAREHFADCRVAAREVHTGEAADAIIAYARSARIDLIVIGTHGRKWMDRFLFGGVAQKVLILSTIPVLAMNPYKVARRGDLFDFSVAGDDDLEEELEQYDG